MKWLKVFAAFVILQIAAWVGAHWYKSANPETVLIVADTSFALKPHFTAMREWIDNYSNGARYRVIDVGTDKAFIGKLSELKSTDSLFRVSFGRSSADSLKRYANTDFDEYVFLSDGSFSPAGWTSIDFN